MTEPLMQALVVRGPQEHALEQVPRPVPAAGEALVATTHVAVCGTDIRLLRGTLHDAEYPVIPGHEWTGRVVEAPSRPELVGARVVGDGITPCGACARCAEQKPNLCEDLDEVAFTRPGAFADFFCIPAANLRVLPEELSGAEGCLLEPLCVALHAVERAPALEGRAVGVIGGGTIGLLVGQLAVVEGAKSVRVVEPGQPRRAVAAELGLSTDTALRDWDEDQPEIVFDATGVADVFPQGLRATRPGGSYVLVGYSGEDATNYEPSTAMLRELSVHGVLSGYGQLDRALEVVTSGAVRLGPLLSEPLPFQEYGSVLDDRGENAPLRSVFTSGAE
ncbi:2-deoxy-scyllo-inosamine dehydrogenase [Saccharopolyspora antimicrobica]|uniref:2-deoxy-scyllo-inosamine dehydrogenase n=1 Tax=Saccharopolyspora antimicrobica TaxID=455193 RepID=A0A1I4WTF3_9PSEU|nr:alcohol dehydrogenase catalytic domain-containing protein [Saccharopolyspora antimicrobica]RKT82960.1 2-deoxy-scyllo-inosamine dehydrogenase [Saccharopolyspora antimicrobica]SFN17098.1 2-deoxy-scyllo-inosamine dehydrogenase [Saccharopolyspora antimicrobica]